MAGRPHSYGEPTVYQWQGVESGYFSGGRAVMSLRYSIIPPSSTVQYRTVQYSTVQYSTVQYSTVPQYSTVQYSTEQNRTVQYSTVQYSTTVQGAGC